MRRRDFFLAASAMTVSVGPTSKAREPISRSGTSRFNLGLAAYSLRKYFAFDRGKPNTPPDDGPALDMVGFLDYCRDLGCQAAELTSYFFPPEDNLSRHDLRAIKHAAFIRGLTISGTAIGNNFTVGKGPKLDAEIAAAQRWIERAATLGAPHLRVFAGTRKQLERNPERMAEAISAINHCAKLAEKKGVFLGIENHGGLTAPQMIQILKRIESEWVGINLDTGNFISDDPYADIRACAPYAVNVQVKTQMRSPAGETTPADFAQIAAILKESGFQGNVILEFEEQSPYQHIPTAYAELKAAFQN